MMKIIRVEENVTKSIIPGNKIDKLPELLKNRVIKLLEKLTGVKSITVDGDTERAILETSDANKTLDSLDPKTKREFVRTIDLLRWYLKPHWRSRPGIIGGEVRCTDCGHSFSIHEAAVGYCPDFYCPSHAKWKRIIGPSYQSPREKLSRVLKKALNKKD